MEGCDVPIRYIGKRKFEKAFEQFPWKDNVPVEWEKFSIITRI